METNGHNFQSKKSKSSNKKITTQRIKIEKTLKPIVKKKKKSKKKTGPSIYSKEYLEKKHGIKIDED